MRKLMKSFQKRQSIASRVLCFLLVLAMVVTMVPALGGGNSTVQAAENPTVRLYFEKPDDWNIPAFNYWNESDVAELIASIMAQFSNFFSAGFPTPVPPFTI